MIKVKQDNNYYSKHVKCEYRYNILYPTGNVDSLHRPRFSVFNDVSWSITSGRQSEKLVPSRSNTFSSVSLFKLQYTY